MSMPEIRTLTLGRAIVEALAEEMRRDPRVIILGEDVAFAGGVFKATAGLHRAVRMNGEHGFLNLLAAVVFGDEERALQEAARDAFRLGPDAFSWRNRSVDSDELARVRRERLHSIGSCSFFEPVAELEALGVLPL